MWLCDGPVLLAELGLFSDGASLDPPRTSREDTFGLV